MASDTTITTSESTTPTRTNSIHDTRKPSFEIEKQVGSDDVVHNLTIEGEMTAHVYPIMSNTKAIMLTLVVTCSMVLNIMNAQAVTIALQVIGTDLNIEISNFQWLTAAYSLAFGSLLLLFGRLADLFGHKKVFILGQIWFAIWSIGVGFAPNEISIDIMRALQGAGMSASIPAALGILGSSFAPSQAKSTAFASFSAGAPIGASIGGVLGGILTEYATWRAIFWTSAGLAALIAIGAWIFVPDDRDIPIENRDVDWLGAGLITVGLALVTFALADGSGAPDGWKTPYIPTLFVIGIISIITFWYYERYLEYRTNKIPLMKVSLWSRGRFVWIQLIGFLGWSSFTTFLFLVTLYFQDYQHLSPISATVRFLPSAVTGIIINIIAAIVVSRIPAVYLIIFGTLGTAAGPLLFALQKEGSSYWQFEFIAMVVSVFGIDFIFSCGILYVSLIALPSEQGLAGGIFNATTQIGTAFGLTIMTIIQTSVTRREVERLGGIYDPNHFEVPDEAKLKGLQAALLGCAGFALATTLIAVLFLRDIGYVGERTPKNLPQAGDEETIEGSGGGAGIGEKSLEDNRTLVTEEI